MYRRTDPINYKKMLNPFCVKCEKILNKNDVALLQTIKLPKNTDFYYFTRKNIISHQCCEKYNKNEEQIINNISEKIRLSYEKQIGKKLYYMGDNKATIYRYNGKNSHHLWHVDTNNTSEIYNAIVCIKKIGDISPLQYKDKNNKEHSIYFKEGDAALFNGGVTVHQVPPNNDAKSERTVLSVAFTSNKNMNKSNHHLNLVTYIKGGSDKVIILNLILIIFITNYFLTHISGINKIPHHLLMSYFLTILFMVKYVPQYFDTGLGTNRSSSLYYNFMLLIFFMLMTISIKGAIIFFTYFLISDLFFSRKWVAYS